MMVVECWCIECESYFAGAPGARRCGTCQRSRDERAAEALEKVQTRAPATTISAGWAQLSEANAAATRHDLNRAGLGY